MSAALTEPMLRALGVLARAKTHALGGSARASKETHCSGDWIFTISSRVGVRLESLGLARSRCEYVGYTMTYYTITAAGSREYAKSRKAPRPVASESVACPTCLAKPGDNCRTCVGRYLRRPHARRRTS